MTTLAQISSTGARPRRGNLEAYIQAAIVAYVRTCLPGLLCCHVPNGGLRTKAEAARLRWQGVLAGFPDLLIIRPGGMAYLLEVKVPGGALSADQRDIRNWALENAVPHKVVRSLDDAIAAFAEWNLTTRCRP